MIAPTTQKTARTARVRFHRNWLLLTAFDDCGMLGNRCSLESALESNTKLKFCRLFLSEVSGTGPGCSKADQRYSTIKSLSRFSSRFLVKVVLKPNCKLKVTKSLNQN